MIYHIFADELLDRHSEYCDTGDTEVDFVFVKIPIYGEFGFTIKLDYSGLMAAPSRTGRNRGRVKRPQQGLFDIMINTGSFFGGGGMSHRDILESVVHYSTWDNCVDVWRGENPSRVARNDDEMAILTTIALAFFEQTNY